MRRCSSCVLPEVYPGISFDAEGRRNYCASHERYEYLGENRLSDDLRKNRREKAEYDCLVPLSGGKGAGVSVGRGVSVGSGGAVYVGTNVAVAVGGNGVAVCCPGVSVAAGSSGDAVWTEVAVGSAVPQAASAKLQSRRTNNTRLMGTPFGAAQSGATT